MSLVARRTGFLFAIFFALLAIAGLRTGWLATVEGGTLQKRASTQQVHVVPLPARRGAIVDRNGAELAVSEPADDVSATAYLVKDKVTAAAELAPILGATDNEILKKLATNAGFVWLARALPSAKADRVAKLNIPGIDLTPTTRRVYPRDWLASQVLGRVGTDGTGLSGLEYTFDKAMHGRDGQRRLVKDAFGEPIAVEDTKIAEPGKRIELTIDADIQDRTEDVLGQIGAQYKPKGATAVVMDPENGELLAVANWPKIDNNAPIEAAPESARQNRATGYNYEPGSTFKAFTVAGALEEGVVTPETTFDLPPKIQVADREIGESHDRPAVTFSVGQILAQSSNVGAVKIGLKEGADDFAKWVTRFGFGQKTGVDLPGEQSGIVVPRDKYSGSSMGNMPIGQGIAVTPMQMARAYAAIANGGTLVRPHVVEEIGGEKTRGGAGRRVISEKTALQLRTMLEGVFAPGGTAAEVAIDGYKLAGKTGTANKPDPKTGEYSKENYIASFVGFAPALKPKLLVSVMVDEPKGAIYGGEVAAPAFGRIMQFALSHLEIPPG